MNPKKIKIIPLVFLLMFVVSTALFPFFEFVGFCDGSIQCDNLKGDYIDPIAIILLALFLSSILLFITQIYWLRLTLIWSVIVLLVFILSPTEPGGASIPLEPVRDEAVLYISIPYILISWAVALWGYFKKSS